MGADEHTGRRAFMAGAAGLAVGAALLGGSSPAGASSTTDDIDPFWVDEAADPDVITPIVLGDGGSATARWVAEGDLCAMTLEIVLGEDAAYGDGFWGLDGSTFPVGYVPLIDPPVSPNDVRYQWVGNGLVIDLSQPTQGSHPVVPVWGSFAGTGGPAAGMLWAVIGQPGPPRRLGDGGTAPFDTAPGAGTFLWSTTVYRRVVPVE